MVSLCTSSHGASAGTDAAAISLVSAGKPDCTIVTGTRATRIERHAARELQTYIRKITGAEIAIRAIDAPSSAPSVRNLVLVGRAKTNPLVGHLTERGLLKLSADTPGLDGFIIKQTRLDDKKYLVLGGSSDVGTLYAVYDFLERFCGVGFFWDVEQVPSVKTLVIRKADIASRPRFPNRMNMQACAYGYTATFWLFDDWKREIDWTLKNKFNILYYPVVEDRQECLIQTNVMRAFGAKAPDPTAWDLWMADLSKRFIRYARDVGIKVTTPTWSGVVTEEFKQAHPDVDYLPVQWLDLPPDWQIRPSDPMYVKVGLEYLREFARLYGPSDHIYTCDPYAECRPGTTAEEQLSIKLDYARAVSGTISEADPKGVWSMNAWAFQDQQYWPPDQLKAMLDVIDNSKLIVNDTIADRNSIAKRCQYFYGKRWGFATLQAFGGETQLHGDIAGTMKQLQALKGSAEAERCVQYYLNPEIIQHNPMYFDAVIRTAWDPAAITFDGWLDSYTIRRYGSASAGTMKRFLLELTSSVYSRAAYGCPLYQSEMPREVPADAFRPDLIEHLGRALEIGMAEAGSQAGNEAYERDMHEVMRQYLGELFNKHALDLSQAFRSGDLKAFDSAAGEMRRCLALQEKVLSARREYYLQEEIERANKAAHRGGKYKRADVSNAEDIRIRYTTLISLDHDTINDYAHKDMIELVQHYYSRRVEAYLAALRSELSGSSAAPADLKSDYKKILVDFAKTDRPVKLPAAGCVGVEAVRSVMEDLGLQVPAGKGSRAAGETRGMDYGGKRTDFSFGEWRGFVILPTGSSARAGRPWVWYAPAIGNVQPGQANAWLVERLLAAGFAVGGADVGESYGSPAGRAGFTQFYELVVKRFGLSSKPCLWAQSRGGLQHYNWAAEHPDCVSCIGGTYTVCDPSSWPGLAKACGAYALTESQLRERLSEHNPLDRLAPLAEHRIPILHMHGDRDVVVPLEANSAELARRYRALGGVMDLIVVLGKGHEEADEFFKDPRMLSFFVEHAWPSEGDSNDESRA